MWHALQKVGRNKEIHRTDILKTYLNEQILSTSNQCMCIITEGPVVSWGHRQATFTERYFSVLLSPYRKGQNSSSIWNMTAYSLSRIE